MNNTTMPDFEQRANDLVEEYTKTKYSNCTVAVYRPEAISLALQQAFEQGVSFGKRTTNTDNFKGVL